MFKGSSPSAYVTKTKHLTQVKRPFQYHSILPLWSHSSPTFPSKLSSITNTNVLYASILQMSHCSQHSLTLNILVVLSSAIVPLFTIEWKSGITTVQDIFTHIQSLSPTVRVTTFLQNLQKFAVDMELHINSDNIFPSYFTACSFHLRIYTKSHKFSL